jgi:hypothetical protein
MRCSEYRSGLLGADGPHGVELRREDLSPAPDEYVGVMVQHQHPPGLQRQVFQRHLPVSSPREVQAGDFTSRMVPEVSTAQRVGSMRIREASKLAYRNRHRMWSMSSGCCRIGPSRGPLRNRNTLA